MGFPDVSSFPCPSPYRGCGGWQFGNRMHHLMRSFHPSIINIAEGSIFRPPGGKKFLKIYFGVPQGSAQLLSGEGACVTFYAVRSMERGSMAVGDFSTLWRSCIGPPSQPKLASSLPNKRLSYCRLTGCARNDSERVHWSFFLTIISREVVKKGCLCNINVWRRKSGNSMEGFSSRLPCISRIFRPECIFGR